MKMVVNYIVENARLWGVCEWFFCFLLLLWRRHLYCNIYIYTYENIYNTHLNLVIHTDLVVFDFPHAFYSGSQSLSAGIIKENYLYYYFLDIGKNVYFLEKSFIVGLMYIMKSRSC